MKKLYLCCVAIAALTACTDNSTPSSNQTQEAPAVNGGGGSHDSLVEQPRPSMPDGAGSALKADTGSAATRNPATKP